MQYCENCAVLYWVAKQCEFSVFKYKDMNMCSLPNLKEICCWKFPRNTVGYLRYKKYNFFQNLHHRSVILNVLYKVQTHATSKFILKFQKLPEMHLNLINSCIWMIDNRLYTLITLKDNIFNSFLMLKNIIFIDST